MSNSYEYIWTSKCGGRAACLPSDGCPPGVCPDLTIRRHDTMPEFKVSVHPQDLDGVAVEASMWMKSKFARAVGVGDTELFLAGNLGFNQLAVGDMIVVDRPRSAEQMLVTGFDEDALSVLVERGYNNTTPAAYKKGVGFRGFRVLNAVGSTEMVRQDILRVDGTTDEQVLVESSVIYGWSAADTAMPGCFLLELKLIGLDSDANVLWTRRYPDDGREGYLIRVTDSPTAEDVVVVRGRHFMATGGISVTGNGSHQ